MALLVVLLIHGVVGVVDGFVGGVDGVFSTPIVSATLGYKKHRRSR